MKVDMNSNTGSSPGESALQPPPEVVGLSRAGRQLRFLAVGGICYIITIVINFALKWTILSEKPTTALIIATSLASIVSYLLNKRWTFESRGSNNSALEVILFGLVTVGGILVNSMPLYISRYLLGFESPPHTLMFQEIADFISGPILGTALAMVFRWAAMDLIVFRKPKLDNIETPKSDYNQHFPM